MLAFGEFREVVSTQHIPVAVTMGLSDILRQLRQTFQIFPSAFGLHQSCIVVDQRLNKRIVFRILVLFGIVRIRLIDLIYEKSLDPKLCYRAGFLSRASIPFG